MSLAGRLFIEAALVALMLGLASVLLHAMGPDVPGAVNADGIQPGELRDVADREDGLSEAVERAMPESGVKHPVTAVLLNFRGYDTLLEMLVLLLAMIGVRSLGELPKASAPEPPSPVLTELLRLLTPILLLVSVYLLWRGSSGPGGAFQAGAILCAAGVLWQLTDRSTQRRSPGPLLRPLLIAGLAGFSAIGLSLAVTEGAFLAYPTDHAGSLIFAIEALATVSIATTLLVLFTGAPAREA